MAETINWSVTFDVVLGPTISESGNKVVAAYDKVSIQLAGHAVDVDVDVQPSTVDGQVELLVLRASSYDAGVTISADAGTTTFTVDGPVVLIGSGAVALLAKSPQTLRFSNPDDDAVDIDVIVARQA